MSEVVHCGIDRVFLDDFMNVSYQRIPSLFSHESVGFVEFRDKIRGGFLDLHHLVECY